MASLKQRYKNQVDRIRKSIKRSSSYGFVFDDELADIIRAPKKITEGTIRRLQKLTAAKLRKKHATEYVDFTTGEVYSTREGEGIYKKVNKAIKKILKKGIPLGVDPANNPDIVIQNFRDYIAQFVYGANRSETDSRDYAIEWLEKQIATKGKTAVATAIMAAQGDGGLISIKSAYHRDMLISELNRILSFLEVEDEERNDIIN